MTDDPIVISGMGTISGLGHDSGSVIKSYSESRPKFKKREDKWISPLHDASDIVLAELISRNSKYKKLDRSVLLGIYAARMAKNSANWTEEIPIGINIGSSRGATQLFESFYTEYLQKKKNTSPYVSPTTTLGNLSSWIAHDLKTSGPAISHSITCSTSGHSLLNGYAWIKSGIINRFIVGGTEAPLTDFTLSQMEALGIYSKENTEFASRPMDIKKIKNTMILGEGSACFAIEKLSLCKVKPLAVILSIGYGLEPNAETTGISEDGLGLVQSMNMCLINNSKKIDAIIVHAPGTIAGDNAELKAIHKVFGLEIPTLFSNKWLIGHTLGASFALSLELGIRLLQDEVFPIFPYETTLKQLDKKNISSVMINSIGFGGNAASILISKP